MNCKRIKKSLQYLKVNFEIDSRYYGKTSEIQGKEAVNQGLRSQWTMRTQFKTYSRYSIVDDEEQKKFLNVFKGSQRSSKFFSIYLKEAL